jgi:hypothetical protein
MFVDKLLGGLFQNNDKVVKTLYYTFQAGTVNKENCNRDLFFPEIIEKEVLKLTVLVGHNASPLNAKGNCMQQMIINLLQLFF